MTSESPSKRKWLPVCFRGCNYTKCDQKPGKYWNLSNEVSMKELIDA